MKSIAGKAAQAIAWLVLGAVSAVALVFWNPFAAPTIRAMPIVDVSANGLIKETFVINPKDVVAVTHSGAMPLPLTPLGIAPFNEPVIKDSLALLAKVRDTEGQIIGFALESETLQEDSNLVLGKMRSTTDWTVVLPLRGTLLLTEIEDSGEVGKNVIASVVSGRTWTGPLDVNTTVGPLKNHRGLIVGGTGAFEGVTGEFVEFNRLLRWSKKDGAEGIIKLHLAYRKGNAPPILNDR